MTTVDSRRNGVTVTWQAHCLTGPYRDVGIGLFSLPHSVVTGPWYLLLLQIDERAGVHLFTRQVVDDPLVVSHEWTGLGFGDLPATVFRSARERNSPSDIETALRSRCGLTSSTPSLAPVSPRGAFGRPFDTLRGHQARALVLAW